MPQFYLTIAAVLAVAAYYAVTWLVLGRDPAPGTIVTRYEPPAEISPAMVRFVWNEGFDDRAFWAGVLSLVAKGLVKLESTAEGTLVWSISDAPAASLPPEEVHLLKTIELQSRHRAEPFNLLDGRAAYAAIRMAATLRQAAIGRWFDEHREYVLYGVIFSMAAVTLSASPRNLRELGALFISLSIATPGAFYLLLIFQRLRDLLRAARRSNRREVLGRTFLMAVFLVPCIAAIALAAIVIGGISGWPPLFAVSALVPLNLSFLFLLKAPTPEGRMMLDEIEGFREFLISVNKLPLDKTDAPSNRPHLYEQYLPYAVALDVEQQWCDRFVALAESYHTSKLAGTHSFYLGMWNDKPVEIAIGPRPR